MKQLAKPLLIPVILALFSLTSCLKSPEVEDFTKRDDDAIQAFLAGRNITNAQKLASGIYFVHLEEGSGPAPTTDDIVDISYRLERTDNVVLEANGEYTFVPKVGSFLPGLNEAVLTMAPGGRTLFVLPSRLAFGAGSGQINGVTLPPNSVLVITVRLRDVRDEALQLNHEKKLIAAYLDSLGHTWQERPDGLAHVVLQAGEGTATPTSGALTTVNYEGTYLSGGSFDSGNNFNFLLAEENFIKGWYEGIKLMKKDEEALIVIPSGMAYGAAGTQTIPPFSPLVFKIKLLSFTQ